MATDTSTTAKRRLGCTEIEITPIGLGTWQFSGAKGYHGLIWPEVQQNESDAIVAAALAGGIGWFDTAEAYGHGHSERDLAHGLTAAGKQPGDVVIATKWRPQLRRAGSIATTIDERIASLTPFPIDLHQVHNPASFSSVDAEMNAMADLVEQGKIRAIGVSNFSAGRMRRAHEALARRGLPLASNQVKYSLLDRGIERNGVLEAAKELGVTIIAYSPLEMGLLTGKFHRDPAALKSRPLGRRVWLGRKVKRSAPVVEVLEGIAAARGVTPAQVALSWLVSFHGDAVVAIPGATRPQQAAESAGALALKLSDEELRRIDELTRSFV
jgi:aryl-alcohol dehydrogenase-like predicted oxidoreductase